MPEFAIDSTNLRSFDVARTRTGLSAEPWVSALPSRLENNCAMRPLSQSTGRVTSNSVSIRRVRIAWRAVRRSPGRAPAPALAVLRFSAMPPPSRPRAKSSTLSISADIRATLCCISARIGAASLFAAHQQLRSRRDRRQRIAQIVAEHGDELLAQLRGLALAEQPGLAGGEAVERRPDASRSVRRTI